MEKKIIRTILILAGIFLISIVSAWIFSWGRGIDLGLGGKVAWIPVKGGITVDGGSMLGGERVSASRIVGFIERAEENPRIGGIVLEINSPGGSAVGSDEIGRAVKKAKKPVVALIREIGASGGYWVASAADTIVANRMSITGSIGVLSSYLEFSRLMEEYGITYQRLVAGKYKDMGSPFRNLTEEEKELLERKLERIQGFFIEEIAENRGLEREKVEEMATGEFFLGVEAKELGLVDLIGDKETVEEWLKKELNLTEISYVRYEEKISWWEMLAKVLGEQFFYVGKGIGSVLVGRDFGLRI